MKKFILIPVLLLAGLYCFSFVKSSTNTQKKSVPTTIVLQDNSLSTTLQCTNSGSVWQISSGDAGAYLALVSNGFGQTGVSNFHDFQLKFTDDYASGSLTGIGSNQNGTNVPIGIEYVFHSQDGSTITMLNTDKHTCTGDPCSCCAFIEDSGGGIKGCKCKNDNDCHLTGNDRCNHTVTTQ